jgi:hypothetical protein
MLDCNDGHGWPSFTCSLWVNIDRRRSFVK